MVFVLVLGLVATISAGHIWYKSYAENRFDNSHWGFDLYQFWYAGHFFWHGQDPYTAILSGEEPDYPSYLHPPKDSAAPAKLTRTGLATILPGSAPLFLVLAPLSLLPWTEATLCWGIVNVLLGIVYVWLLLQVGGLKLPTTDGLMVLCILFSMQATRQVIDLGQNSLLISALMFAAWYLQERRLTLPAGILLGIAMSKYTLAFPVFLYFIYRRWYKAAVSALLTQLAGLFIVSLVTGTDPRQIVAAYAGMSTRVMQQTQIDSIHLFRLSDGPAAYIVCGIVSLALILGLLWWYKSRSPSLPAADNMAGVALIGIVTLWSFICMYHSRHDMVAGLPLVVLAVQLASSREQTGAKFNIGPWQLKLFYALISLILAVWILPLYTLTGHTAYRYLLTGSNIGAFMLLLFLLFSIKDPSAQRIEISIP